MDLLRFLTAGNVDDGKSTLIGRMLYDSKSVSVDVLHAIETASKGNGNLDLSLLTDGLRAEREQGITIDVAYKYFTTAKRKFIIADAPGHFQYTRNMVTAASNSQLAIILIDARNGITEQTCRHSIISSLFGIRHLVVCINKIDLVNYSENLFHEIADNYKSFAKKLDAKDIVYIPLSARMGDNVVKKSANMPWYSGKTLLEHLETVEVDSDINLSDGRFPVQYVIRPNNEAMHDYRGYAGKIISGIFRKGDRVKVFSAGAEWNSQIKEIEAFGEKTEEVFAPQPAIFHLEDDIDISRGDMIVKEDGFISSTQDVEATVCWMDSRPLTAGAKFLIRHHGKTVKAAVRDVLYKINVSTMEKKESDKTVNLNEIARIQLRAALPLALDLFSKNRSNGSFILLDENTNDTVGGCVM